MPEPNNHTRELFFVDLINRRPRWGFGVFKDLVKKQTNPQRLGEDRTSHSQATP
jgi:hypothetical protein